MKRIKRIFAALLCLVMALTAMPIFASAEGETAIEAAKCTINPPQPGETPDMDPVSDEPDKYSVSLEYWYLGEDPCPHVEACDTFEFARIYAVRIKFTANDGYAFDKSTAFKINNRDAWLTGSNNNWRIFEIRFTTPRKEPGITVRFESNTQWKEVRTKEGLGEGEFALPDAMDLMVPNFKRLKGWLAPDGRIYTPGSKMILTGDVTLTAQWEDVVFPTLFICQPSTYKIEYGHTLILEGRCYGMPEDCRLEWTVFGDAFTYSVNDDGTLSLTAVGNGYVRVVYAIVDADGNIFNNSDDEPMTTDIRIGARSNFFLKIIAFFKNLFKVDMTVR